MQHNINASVNVLPCDILIHRVKTTQGTFVNYFDIGLPPNAVRVYIRNEVVDFLLNLNAIKRLNTNLFLAKLLKNISIKIKSKSENTETLVVHAGNNYIQPIILRSATDIENELQKMPDDTLIDYYTFQASDTQHYYVCLFEYNDTVALQFSNCNVTMDANGFSVTSENSDAHTEKGEEKKEKEKPKKLNKAGIPILDK